MSKPLIFVLQLIGLFCLFFGAPRAMEGSVTMLAIGIGLILVAGIGWRKRMKKN